MPPTNLQRSGIARLLKLVNEPRHDYRPNTDIFLEIDPETVSSDMRLAELGAERGASERPATDAHNLDDIEHRVIERIENHKQDAHHLFLDHLHTYEDRISALHFEERFAIIRQAAPEAVGDFKAEAGLGRDELYALRRRVADTERERNHFKELHKLTRTARVSTTGGTIFKVGLLAVMFVIEVVVNGGFLAKSSEQGILGGAVQAVSFAALNILASFLLGLVPIRLLNRRSIFLKLLGLLGLVFYLVFAVGLNLTLAHLREIPPTLSGDVGQEVLQRLLHTPYMLNDVNSFVFFGIGFIFSLVAMADGVLFTDPYPGYASMEKRWLGAGQHYTDRKAELIDQLREIRDTAKEAMNGAARDLSVRRSEFDSILQARGRLASRFAEHQNHIERAGRTLLAVYREANQKARKTAAPPYFAKGYEMQRIAYGGDTEEGTAREQLRQSIKDSQQILEAQITAIHEEFDRAVASYREIDQLIPEADNAPPQK
ncbi:hypothetical protein [Pseudolabrys sp.]|uniref:hypothetical protein n=1 Tax=Pseudolabrys sp. TaxID=1960880 RepID=UPI003D0AACD1